MRNDVQKVEVYLDYATLPTLAYFLHFIEHWQDKETIRLFGLARFSLSEAVLAEFPAGVVQFYAVETYHHPDFNQAFQRLLENTTKPLELRLHLNSFHAVAMLRSLWASLNAYSHKLASVKVNLYDDGSEGATNLYQLSQQPDWLAQMLAKPVQAVQAYWLSGQRSWAVEAVFRYRLHHLLPTDYWLFDPQLLSKFSPLAELKASLPNYQKMPSLTAANLNDEQKSRLLKLLNLDAEYVQQLVALSNQLPSFLFTGTAVFWDKGYEKSALLEALHTELLQRYLNEAGENQLFLFKGHPAAKAMNAALKAKFGQKVGFLPDDIPLEVFFLLGLKPQLVGGFASSSYFNLQPEQIHSAFFITEDPKGQLAYPHLYQAQANLKAVLLALGYVRPAQCYSHTQLYAVAKE